MKINKLRAIPAAVCCFIIGLCAVNQSNASEHIRCWDLKEQGEKPKRVVCLDFLQNPQEYREGKDHITFEKYGEKPINWNADPTFLAQRVLIGGYGVEDICISNVNNMNNLKYSITFYIEIFNNNHDITPSFYPCNTKSAKWISYVDKVRESMEEERTKIIDNWLYNMDNIQYESDEDEVS